MRNYDFLLYVERKIKLIKKFKCLLDSKFLLDVCTT